MKQIKLSLLLLFLLSWVLFGQGIRPVSAEEYYFAIEINGTLCGYAKFTISPLVQEGRKLLLLEHTILMQVRALGRQVESRLKLTFHLDPETNGFSYHDSTIDQGGQSMFVKMRIDGGRVYVSGTGMDKEEAVELPPDVVLENTLFSRTLRRISRIASRRRKAIKSSTAGTQKYRTSSIRRSASKRSAGRARLLRPSSSTA